MRVSGILNLSTLLKHVRVQQERVDSLFTPDSIGTRAILLNLEDRKTLTIDFDRLKYPLFV